MKKPITFSEFLNQVGRKRFQDAIDVSTQLVTRALNDELMPAHWFLKVRDWCVSNQIDVPEHLFRWEPKSRNKQNANSEACFQGTDQNKNHEARG